jgi:outer membrane murein-binding lipoprotein Lpp
LVLFLIFLNYSKTASVGAFSHHRKKDRRTRSFGATGEPGAQHIRLSWILKHFRSYPMELKTMKNTAQSSFNQLRGLKLAALALGSTLVLAGCAGNPPTEQYAVTQSAVNSAVSAGGTEFAAVEMKAAQDKFKQAEIAMHDKNYDEAKRLAEQAEWDARVAERKAQAAKAQKAVQDARQGVEDLRDESMRKTQ